MTDHQIHTIETAPEESKGQLQQSKDTIGFVPNLHAVMAEAPGLLATYKFAHEQFQKSSFNKEELTVVWQTINVEHDCHYCVPAHTGIAHSMKVDPAINEALRNETPLADARLEALRTFVLSVVRNRGQVDDAEVVTFLNAGFTKRHVLEVVLGVAQKVMSNYINHLADTPIDPPFQNFNWEKAA